MHLLGWDRVFLLVVHYLIQEEVLILYSSRIDDLEYTSIILGSTIGALRNFSIGVVCTYDVVQPKHHQILE